MLYKIGHFSQIHKSAVQTTKVAEKCLLTSGHFPGTLCTIVLNVISTYTPNSHFFGTNKRTSTKQDISEVLSFAECATVFHKHKIIVCYRIKSFCAVICLTGFQAARSTLFSTFWCSFTPPPTSKKRNSDSYSFYAKKQQLRNVELNIFRGQYMKNVNDLHSFSTNKTAWGLKWLYNQASNLLLKL